MGDLADGEDVEEIHGGRIYVREGEKANRMRDKTPREALPPPHRTERERPGPVATIGNLAEHSDWIWITCNGCLRSRPSKMDQYVARWGAEASSDLIRQRVRCSACGHLGVHLQRTHLGDPFPVDEPASAAFDRLYAEFGPHVSKP